ncbi:MAG: OmpA family protein [Elusimicrobia bacterium]|nr:OmpA family protein [Elusimicrobiota bacterium]
MIPFLHRVAPESMEDNPLWLVVLCDMMTNLMLFFLVMYTFSIQGPKAKAEFERAFRLEEAVEAAPPAPAPAAPVDPAPALRAALAAAGLAAEAEVTAVENGVRVRLREGVLFPFGTAELAPRAAAPLAVIAGALKDAPHEVVVEGYTDDRPVLGGSYRTNWELSVARAHAVLARLAGEGLAPARLTAAGYGPYRPAAANDTEEGRAKNRRVELLILRPEDE